MTLPPDPVPGEHSDLVSRLRKLGQASVDPAIAVTHVAAMAAARPGARTRRVRGRFERTKVMAAFAAGLLLGGTGLATAGALGNRPQDAVADAADHVGLDLPGGTARSTEGCDGKSYKNHGQFVAQGGDPHSKCGKPVKSTDKPKDTSDKTDDTDETPGAGKSGNGCGKPPWAGKGNHAKKTPEAVAARKAACGDDDESDDDETETPTTTPGAVVPPPSAVTTTTVAPTTSTSTTSTTTTSTTTTSTTTTSTTTTTVPPASTTTTTTVL